MAKRTKQTKVIKGGGSWGTFDDQNDSTHDLAIDIEDNVLPKSLTSLKTYSSTPKKKVGQWIKQTLYKTEDDIANRKKQEKYLKSNVNKIATEIKKHKLENWRLSGIAMYMVRNWYGSSISKLPTGFPKQLQNAAYKASLQQLKDFDNTRGWNNPDERIRTLKKQVKLFQYGGRPSPTVSAKNFKIGTVKKGNDGKMWKVIQTKNKVKRWVHKS
jgi:membrane carboxypeptidase/penicillin-binding protein